MPVAQSLFQIARKNLITTPAVDAFRTDLKPTAENIMREQMQGIREETLQTVRDEMKTFRDEVKALRDEIKIFREEMRVQLSTMQKQNALGFRALARVNGALP